MDDMLYLAPFHGLTPFAYRNLFGQYFNGIDAAYAPFASNVGEGKINPSKLNDIMPGNIRYHECVPQILSNSGAEILAYGNAVADMGYKELNWNLGCPFTRITNKKKGAGMLEHPDELFEILDFVLPRLPLALSIKTRLGMRRDDELRGIMERLNAYPLKKLILHPRIGLQKYDGFANAGVFAEIARTSRIPMVYNGDILSIETFHSLKSVMPDIREWMIGRAALINPFLPSAIKTGNFPDAETRRTILIAFHEDLLAQCSEKKGSMRSALGSMKALWNYMGGMFGAQEQMLIKMKRAASLEEFLPIADAVLQTPSNMDIELHFRSMK